MEKPLFAKVPFFLGYRAHVREDLTPFVFSRLCCFECVFEEMRYKHTYDACGTAVAILAAELLRLCWPKSWVSFSFKCFAFYKQNLFERCVRKFGRLLQKSVQIAVWSENFRDTIDVVPDLVALFALAREWVLQKSEWL
jgi:hypothetical protein